VAAVRRGFAEGDERTWEQLIDLGPEPAVPARDGYLEAATQTRTSQSRKQPSIWKRGEASPSCWAMDSCGRPLMP
jgi:hypothetical protein